MSFLTELKRRNVLRVGIAYAVVSWLLLQVSDTLVPALRLPEWFHSGVALLLILGFPVALLFAWAFELTPEGLKKERDIDRSESIANVTGRKLDFVIIGLLVTALAYLAYDKFMLGPLHDAALLESATQQGSDLTPGRFQTEKPTVSTKPTIAVLSFVNMSDDAGNEYFSEGLSEELLNLLVKIPELRVSARTSSFSYKGQGVNVAQIGAELNVAHVLEGSVRKSGDRIRITVQLVKSDDGFQLWSETYDRTLDDIFVVQDEIAKAVVDELRIKLLGAMPRGRKTDPEVYSLYLQGRYFNNLRGEENLENAIAVLEQALDIDPEYAPAWVEISYTFSVQARRPLRPQEQGAAMALEAVERALALDENMAAAWATLAYLKRSFEWDWQGAKVAIDRAMRLEPNNVRVIRVAASIANTSGRLSEATKLYEQSVRLDPLSQSNIRALGINYMSTGRLD